MHADERAENLLNLTADIVAAHVSHNSVAVSDVSTLISNVYSALANAGDRVALPDPSPSSEPIVSVRSSVRPDSITCLICGHKLKMLKRHLRTFHNISPEDYRERFSLRGDYPMTAPNYSDQRRHLAKSIGLGHHPKKSA